ncbi:Uu.00g028150.m01.CDS01 [Anthostomella pinea]|uniref:Uu.00g028150.m01.CDS01 n=1 Tax=Anthostomella pinea TaxID=933095 RepID=A0AAI8V8F6_9PEZI|nr:Uu.00g028150.m01.CDS01 [Anthostomella pinea]
MVVGERPTRGSGKGDQNGQTGELEDMAGSRPGGGVKDCWPLVTADGVRSGHARRPRMNPAPDTLGSKLAEVTYSACLEGRTVRGSQDGTTLNPFTSLLRFLHQRPGSALWDTRSGGEKAAKRPGWRSIRMEVRRIGRARGLGGETLAVNTRVDQGGPGCWTRQSGSTDT